MREKVFFLIALRRAHVNRTRTPIILAAIAVSLLKIFEVLAYPRLIAVAEVDESGVAFAQVFMMIVHERCGTVAVKPRNHLDILFEEIFLNRSHQTAIAVLADEINLFQF